MNNEKCLSLIDQFLDQQIAPGLNLSIFDGNTWQSFSLGKVDDGEVLTTNEIYYDIASLTKTVVSTCALDLVNTGVLNLDEKVSQTLSYLEKFPDLTPTNLLNHTSGLNILNRYDKTSSYTSKKLDQLFFNGQNLTQDQLTEYCYNDLNYIYLGKFLEAKMGQTLDQIVSQFLDKYNLSQIVYNPLLKGINKLRVAPTNPTVEQGIVHDEKARWFGGVSGHAGLFATHTGLQKFTQMWLENGFGLSLDLHKQAILPEKSYKSKVFDQSWLLPESYGLTWRTGRYSASLNHAGFTGPVIFFDVDKQTAVVLTCNHTFDGVNSQRRAVYQRWMGVIAGIF
jgi:CubicO group peptidase (beta-lactamase class C family)